MGDWLLEAATAYNRDSYDQRDRYATHLLIPLETMRTVSYTHLTLPTT